MVKNYANKKDANNSTKSILVATFLILGLKRK